MSSNDQNSLNDSDRIHIPSGSIENWSENIVLVAHDPGTGLSIYTHIGRMPYQPMIWEGVAYIILPDGEVLVNRSLGISRSEAAIDERYRYTPVVPGSNWHFHFNGLAQRAKSCDLSQRLIENEPYEALSYSLIFDGIAPVFDFQESLVKQSWANLHLEQCGSLRGNIRFGDKDYDIDCTGFRDHSAGPRSYVSLKSVAWVLCAFPSGRILKALYVEAEDHPLLNSGFIYDQGSISPVKMTSVPSLQDSRANPSKFVVEGISEGRTISLTGETLGPYFTMTMPIPSGLWAGLKYDSPELTAAVEAPAIYCWDDGEKGYGWIERVKKIKDLRAP